MKTKTEKNKTETLIHEQRTSSKRGRPGQSSIQHSTSRRDFTGSSLPVSIVRWTNLDMVNRVRLFDVNVIGSPQQYGRVF